MRFGGTRGDDPNVFAAPSVNDHEQTARGAHAERDKSLLIRVGFIVRDGNSVGIVKHGNRFGHADTVPAEVDSGLAFFIPLETHNLSVRTSCTYVNPEQRGTWEHINAGDDFTRINRWGDRDETESHAFNRGLHTLWTGSSAA